jgi:hypothetical protein
MAVDPNKVTIRLVSHDVARDWHEASKPFVRKMIAWINEPKRQKNPYFDMWVQFYYQHEKETLYDETD